MVFDHYGYLSQGLRDLGVWPFYEIEDRITCHQEFNGPIEMNLMDRVMEPHLLKSMNIKVSESQSYHPYWNMKKK